VTTFIEGCSRSDTGRSDAAAADFLRSLPTSDAVVWTDSSVPSLLGAEGADIHVVCGRCSSSSSLSYSAGPVSFSFSAESLALIHGLEWCHSHLKSCHFQLALFLTDSRKSALTLLSTASAFLQPKSFWDIWDLSDSLSSSVALSFQWVPGHAGLRGNERADSLAKTGATLPFTHVSCPLTPTIAKIRHTRYFLWRRNLSHNSYLISSVSSEELALPRLICSELSRLRCHGHSLLLSSYLCRLKWKNSSCSACGHPLQDLTHLLLDCPASEPLRHAIFGTTIFDLWSRPWGVARLLGLRVFLHAPSLRRGLVAPPPRGYLLSRPPIPFELSLLIIRS